MKRIKLSPSALSCDFAYAGPQIAEAEAGGAEYLHLDVMDGIFVPNISFGQPVVKSFRKCTEMVLDVHLMITEPMRYIEDFAKAGADIITVHYEATDNVFDTLKKIHACGKKAGISIKPNTSPDVLIPYLSLCNLVLIMTVEPGFGGQKFMPEMLAKVKYLYDIARSQNLDIEFSVDGGINESNARECVLSGANVLVAGSSVLGKDDIKAAAKAILRAANGEENI